MTEHVRDDAGRVDMCKQRRQHIGDLIGCCRQCGTSLLKYTDILSVNEENQALIFAGGFQEIKKET